MFMDKKKISFQEHQMLGLCGTCLFEKHLSAIAIEALSRYCRMLQQASSLKHQSSSAASLF
jgi:hypothetical protein